MASFSLTQIMEVKGQEMCKALYIINGVHLRINMYVELSLLTSWYEEPVGHVDNGVEPRVVPDVILDPSTEIPEQTVDPLGQTAQLGRGETVDEGRGRLPVRGSPQLKLEALIVKVLGHKLK